jgi:hypothetical protein
MNIPDSAVDDYNRIQDLPEAVEPTDAQFIDWAQRQKKPEDWACMVSEANGQNELGVIFQYIAESQQYEKCGYLTTQEIADITAGVMLRAFINKAAKKAWFEECCEALNRGEE